MDTDPHLIECPHLYVVGDSQCRLCLEPVDGLVYWSTERATVGLVMEGGVITDAPPYARKWALGRTVAELPPAEEIFFVTEDQQGTDAEGVDWGDAGMQDPEAVASWTPDDVGAKAPVTYPEYPPLPEAPISINFKPTGEPMITVRGNCAADVTAALNDLEALGVYANVAAAQSMLQAQGAIGGALGPVSPVSPQGPPPGPMAPPAGLPPSGPPFGPNVSVPQAPGYQAPQQQYVPQAPPAPQWGGQGGGGNSGPQPPSERPAGWHVVDVPWARKDEFKQLRAQGTESGNYLRGKIKWGGKGVYFLEPSISGWLAQQGYPVTQ